MLLLLLAHKDGWLSRVAYVMMHNARGDVGGAGHDHILVSIIEGVAHTLKDLGAARAEHVRICAATTLLREVLDVARLWVGLPDNRGMWGGGRVCINWLHVDVTMLQATWLMKLRRNA